MVGASVPTALAVFWGEELSRAVGPDARRAGISVDRYIADRAGAAQQLQALATASDKLAADFGSWRTPWGEINRFQRLTGDIVQPFNDAGSSIPVPSRRAGAHGRRSRAREYGNERW